MDLRAINFGDVDAKNEILKQKRKGERDFFTSYSIPKKIDLNDFERGEKYFILGLKGTGKTALLRFLHDKVIKDGHISELILFKSDVTEEDRQKLSVGAGFEIVGTGDVPVFLQDFKESWKWLIHKRIAALLQKSGAVGPSAEKYFELTGVSSEKSDTILGSFFSKISSGSLNLSGGAFGIAVELGLDIENKEKSTGDVSLSSVNRACSNLLSDIKVRQSVYVFFDELELFHLTSEQFDRDRRIIRDLVYSVAHFNGESAESGRAVFLISSLRTEVLHSVLELGHEIGRDVDDFGERLDWSNEKDSPNHPLLTLVARKISASTKVEESLVWDTFFPDKINNQLYYKFILNTSYYRPRDIVRLLRVAREYDKSSEKFTSAHFDETSTEFSKQTWLEITEELLASYSKEEISALQRVFLGFKTKFLLEDLKERIRIRHGSDKNVQMLFGRKGIVTILEDLFRIGVLGNDFIVKKTHGKTVRRHRWIFRGNATLNTFERMAIHKSLWKHLTLVSDE